MGSEPVLDYHTPETLRAAVVQREYRHIPCRGQTLVSGKEFANLADPFTGVTSTFCAACGTLDDVAEFEWVDTGEIVRSYRNRLRRAAPPSLKIWAILRIAIIVLFSLGGLMGGPVGVVLGLGLAALIVWPIGRLLRVDFRRYR